MNSSMADAEAVGQALRSMGAPPDLTEYVQHIWSQGASDDAYQTLSHVANILVGNHILTFPYDPEHRQYGSKYTSLTCPRPGMSSDERDQYGQELLARCAPVYARLVRFADTDGSGFVTAAEAWEVRDSFECGLKVASLSLLEGDDLDKLSGLLFISREDCLTRLTRYQTFLEVFPDYIGASLIELPEMITTQLPDRRKP